MFRKIKVYLEAGALLSHPVLFNNTRMMKSMQTARLVHKGAMQWVGQHGGMSMVSSAHRPIIGHKKLSRHLNILPRSNGGNISVQILSPKISLNSSPVMTTIGVMHPYLLGTTHFAAVRIFSSSQQRPPPRRIASSLGFIGAGGMLLLGKGKYIIGALKLTKFASLGSMLLTVGAYTAFCELFILFMIIIIVSIKYILIFFNRWLSICNWYDWINPCAREWSCISNEKVGNSL